MDAQALTWDDYAEDEEENQELTVITGWKLWLARVAWGFILLLTLGLFVGGIKPYFEFVLFFPKFWFSSPDYAPALEAINLTPGFYHGYLIVLQGLQVLATVVIALLIFKNKSNDWLALFVSLTLVAYAASQGEQIGALLMNVPALRYAALPSLALAETALLLLLYFFPDGNCSPNWTKPLALIFVLWQISNLLYEGSPMNPALWSSQTRNLVMLAWFSTGLFAQIWSYAKEFSPMEKQQTKWVLFGFVLAVFGIYVPGLLRSVIPALANPGLAAVVYDIVVVEGFSSVAFLLIPVAITVSIMRYGLWEVDSLINRALVYAALTIVMVIMFELFSGLLENLAELVVEEPPGILEALTALAVGALIQPVQDRVQSFVDVRFYAAKVDLGNAIQNFSEQVRDVIEKQELLQMLLTRTIDLLQIGHGAVYMRGAQETMEAVEVKDIDDERFNTLLLSKEVIGELEKGDPVFQGDDTFKSLHPGLRKVFMMFVPLTADRDGSRELAGVMALGPRISGMGYSREDETLMLTLADSASRALRVAELIEKTRRYEQTES